MLSASETLLALDDLVESVRLSFLIGRTTALRVSLAIFLAVLAERDTVEIAEPDLRDWPSEVVELHLEVLVDLDLAIAQNSWARTIGGVCEQLSSHLYIRARAFGYVRLGLVLIGCAVVDLRSEG